jgi:putative flippase GtrA
MRQFALFCVAGTIGFVVDAAIVQALVSGAGFDPYASRIVSFLCAMTATWLFNRRYTFAHAVGESLLHEWLRYAFAMLGGFVVNYGVYALLVWRFALVREWPVLGVAAGAVVGLAVNYASSRFWVFRDRNA